MERSSGPRLKHLQSGTPDGKLVVLIECDMKNSKMCAYASCRGSLEICPKSEAGSRVSFRDLIEAEAVMRL